MNASQRAFDNRLVWLAVVGFSVAMIVLIDGLIVYRVAAISQPFRDFTVFWTAGRAPPPAVYDAAFMTRAQRWYTAGIGYRPFAYPPTALPWLYLFGRLGYWPAAVLWTSLSSVLFLRSALLLNNWRLAWIALLAPMSMFAMAAGQTSLLVASGVITSTAILGSRPIAAGVLLGLVATIKPQIVLLAPIALLATGHMKTLLTAALVGCGLLALNIAMYGTSLWLSWLRAAADLQRLVAGSGYPSLGATPASNGYLLGLGAPARRMLTIAGCLLGIALVVKVWRSTVDVRQRLIALVCGSVLCAPYDFLYDLATLAPAALSLVADRRNPPRAWLVGALGLTASAGPFTAPLIGTLLLMFPIRADPAPQQQAATHHGEP